MTNKNIAIIGNGNFANYLKSIIGAISKISFEAFEMGGCLGPKRFGINRMHFKNHYRSLGSPFFDKNFILFD